MDLESLVVGVRGSFAVQMLFQFLLHAQQSEMVIDVQLCFPIANNSLIIPASLVDAK